MCQNGSNVLKFPARKISRMKRQVTHTPGGRSPVSVVGALWQQASKEATKKKLREKVMNMNLVSLGQFHAQKLREARGNEEREKREN